MESPLRFTSTILFSSLLFFAYFPPLMKASNEFVETVCKESSNHSECLKALASDPRTSTTRSYKELARYALTLGVKHAKDGHSLIKNMMKKETLNKNSAIKECEDAYKGVQAYFENALAELKGNTGMASYSVLLASDDIDRCEKAMKPGLVLPEIASINNLIMFYVNIGNVVTNKV